MKTIPSKNKGLGGQFDPPPPPYRFFAKAQKVFELG